MVCQKRSVMKIIYCGLTKYELLITIDISPNWLVNILRKYYFFGGCIYKELLGINCKSPLKITIKFLFTIFFNFLIFFILFTVIFMLLYNPIGIYSTTITSFPFSKHILSNFYSFFQK